MDKNNEGYNLNSEDAQFVRKHIDGLVEDAAYFVWEKYIKEYADTNEKWNKYLSNNKAQQDYADGVDFDNGMPDEDDFEAQLEEQAEEEKTITLLDFTKLASEKIDGFEFIPVGKDDKEGVEFYEAKLDGNKYNLKFYTDKKKAEDFKSDRLFEYLSQSDSDEEKRNEEYTTVRAESQFIYNLIRKVQREYSFLSYKNDGKNLGKNNNIMPNAVPSLELWQTNKESLAKEEAMAHAICVKFFVHLSTREPDSNQELSEKFNDRDIPVRVFFDVKGNLLNLDTQFSLLSDDATGKGFATASKNDVKDDLLFAYIQDVVKKYKRFKRTNQNFEINKELANKVKFEFFGVDIIDMPQIELKYEVTDSYTGVQTKLAYVKNLVDANSSYKCLSCKTPVPDMRFIPDGDDMVPYYSDNENAVVVCSVCGKTGCYGAENSCSFKCSADGCESYFHFDGQFANKYACYAGHQCEAENCGVVVCGDHSAVCKNISRHENNSERVLCFDHAVPVWKEIFKKDHKYKGEYLCNDPECSVPAAQAPGKYIPRQFAVSCYGSRKFNGETEEKWYYVNDKDTICKCESCNNYFLTKGKVFETYFIAHSRYKGSTRPNTGKFIELAGLDGNRRYLCFDCRAVCPTCGKTVCKNDEIVECQGKGCNAWCCKDCADRADSPLISNEDKSIYFCKNHSFECDASGKTVAVWQKKKCPDCKNEYAEDFFVGNRCKTCANAASLKMLKNKLRYESPNTRKNAKQSLKISKALVRNYGYVLNLKARERKLYDIVANENDAYVIFRCYEKGKHVLKKLYVYDKNSLQVSLKQEK